MLKNHFIISLRNIWRNKFFSFIHVFGLSIGISAALVIFIIVMYEFSFDQFEPNSERIYRIVMDFKMGEFSGSGTSVPAALPNAIKNEVTGVDATIPIMTFQRDPAVDVTVLRNKSSEVFKNQTDVIFTVNDYFQLIPFEWIAGSPSTSLSKPSMVVLSESRAKQYFPGVPSADVVGRRLVYDNNLDVEVSGVVKDFKENTDIPGREFISYATIFETSLRKDFMMDAWDGMTYSQAWVKLTPANDKVGLEKQLNALFQKYVPDANKDKNNTQTLKLQPLSDVHFSTQYASSDQRVAHMPTLYALLIIAGFLLLLACINFVNLSTAQASHRAKEIGIRKTIGSSRKQLISQFLCETLLLTFLSTIVSISLIPFLLQLFSDFIPDGVSFDIIRQPELLLIPVGLLLTVGLIAGCYPAIYLSKFKPAVVLKNSAFAGAPTRSAGLRKILTISQFTVAQFFVIVALMIGKQIHFSLNQELGYRKDAIINFETPRDTVVSHTDRLVQTIAALSSVQMVSTGSEPPAMGGGFYTNIKYNNGEEDISPNVQLRWGDPSFIELYKIKLVAGRNIRSGEHVNELLINEHYAKELGFESPIDALQKELIHSDGSTTPIVGVMHDFHEGSSHRPIGNIIFRGSNKVNRIFHVALDPTRENSWQESIAGIEKAFHEIYSGEDFNYNFFDETIAAFYERDQKTSQLINWATGLSVIISLLGLLGLVIYISEARTKEIGIRKILGATVSNLVFILSKEFVVLIVIAFAIAAPFAWYAVSEWLKSFEYKTPISTWLFVISGLSLLMIAMIILSIQIIRTAIANPVESLRNE